jgi:hypothetical protein
MGLQDHSDALPCCLPAWIWKGLRSHPRITEETDCCLQICYPGNHTNATVRNEISILSECHIRLPGRRPQRKTSSILHWRDYSSCTAGSVRSPLPLAGEGNSVIGLYYSITCERTSPTPGPERPTSPRGWADENVSGRLLPLHRKFRSVTSPFGRGRGLSRGRGERVRDCNSRGNCERRLPSPGPERPTSPNGRGDLYVKPAELWTFQSGSSLVLTNQPPSA